MSTQLGGFLAIPVTEVHPSPENPRERLYDIEDLAASIRERGLIQPLVVQKIPGRDGYRIVAGHRRYLAVKNVGWAQVPCIVRRDMLPDDELLTMLVENGQRAGLDPIEEARAIRRLRQAGRSEQDIAREIGRSPSTIHARLMLLDLPAEEQDALRAGHYTLTHATNLVKAQRALDREKENPVARPVGRPKGAKTKPYFGDTHPLASTVRAVCDHRGTPKVGGVGCGACWETAIRADAQAVAS